MYISEDTLDDLLRAVLRRLLRSGTHIRPSKGWTRELTGVLLEVRKPRARLSRTETKGTLFSCLGETLWYLAGSDKLDHIEYYIPRYKEFSDDGKTLYGAYGPRLLNMRGSIDQIRNIALLLQEKPNSRQAVIQLFNAEDIVEKHEDVPCTCTLQFIIRGERLHMLTNMRSNDAFLGLPHDVFAFTFIQELLARTLGVSLGTYKHAVGSLHLYDRDRTKAREFLGEGWQSTTTMPAMPQGDPWQGVARLLEAEDRIRCGHEWRPARNDLPGYWADLARLLQIYASRGKKKVNAQIKARMVSRVYDPYIDKMSSSTRSPRRGRPR